mmetsp:Transcript_7645/g.10891  ORF Transcript_7645/g.10891 Transcript_7645/m.10891 type:complete len:649 (-) Transcript_7645:38-1984(-)
MATETSPSSSESIGNSLNLLNDALIAASASGTTNIDRHNVTGIHHYRQKGILKDTTTLTKQSWKVDHESSSLHSSKKSEGNSRRSAFDHSSAPDCSDVFAGLIRKKGSMDSPNTNDNSGSTRFSIEIPVKKNNNDNPDKSVVDSSLSLSSPNSNQEQKVQNIDPKTTTISKTKKKKTKRRHQDKRSSPLLKSKPTWIARIQSDARVARVPDIQSVDSRNAFSFSYPLPKGQEEMLIVDVTPTTATSAKKLMNPNESNLEKDLKIQDNNDTDNQNHTATEAARTATTTEDQEQRRKNVSKSQSILHKLLRLDQEEVAQNEAFASTKLCQGIQHLRSSNVNLARWQSSYEVDAPRLIVSSTADQNKNNLSTTTSFPSCGSISRMYDSDYDEDENPVLLENFPLHKPDQSWQQDLPQQGSWIGIDAILTDDSSSDEDMDESDDDSSALSSWKNSLRERIRKNVKPVHASIDQEDGQSSWYTHSSSVLKNENDIDKSSISSFTDCKLAALLQKVTDAKQQHQERNTNSQEFPVDLKSFMSMIEKVDADDFPLTTTNDDSRDDLNISSKASTAPSCTSSVAMKSFVNQLFVDFARPENTKQYQCRSNGFEMFRWSLRKNVDAAERALFRRYRTAADAFSPPALRVTREQTVTA